MMRLMRDFVAFAHELMIVLCCFRLEHGTREMCEVGRVLGLGFCFDFVGAPFRGFGVRPSTEDVYTTWNRPALKLN